jgi:mannose-6-phosphate isomerase-like protein (cupin superfamily)
MRRMLAATLGVLLTSATAVSQAPPRTASAVDITKADIEAVLKHTGTEGAGVDRQIRVVDLGKYNVGVGVLRRGPTKEGAPVGAITHAQVTEVYYIISGGGTLVTGGTIVNPRPFPADGEIVKVAVGPRQTAEHADVVENGFGCSLRPLGALRSTPDFF